MAIRDHYLVLGVSRRENFRGIRDAYRELAKHYHLDRARTDAVDRFRDIQEAYEDLSDPEKRRVYDRELDQNEIIVQSRPEPITCPSRPRPGFRAPGPLSLLREFRSTRPSFETLYERFLRNFTNRQIPKGERIEGLNVDLVLSPEESAQGGTVAVGVPVFFRLPPVLRHRSRVALPLRKLRRSRRHRRRENGLCAYSAHATGKIRFRSSDPWARYP